MKKINRFPFFPLLIVLGFLLSLTVGCEKDTNNDPKNNDTIGNDTTGVTIPAGWSKVGDADIHSMIWSITSDASGAVYVAGYFTNNEGYNYVARWNGTSWTDIGLNANNSIYALTIDASGNVYAVGDFTNGAVPGGGNKYVAKWDGSHWSDIGAAQHNLLLTSDEAGNVYNGTSKWNGSSWSTFYYSGPEISGPIRTLATNPSGTLQYAGGAFSHTNGYHYVARWDGSAWSEVGTLNANDEIQAIVVGSNGNVYAAGSFTNGNLPSTGFKYVAMWDGNSWSELGHLNANGGIYSLAIDRNTGYLYASGYFTNARGNYYVAKWDGTSWTDLGNMALGPTPIYVSPAGKLYSVVASQTGQHFYVVVHD